MIKGFIRSSARGFTLIELLVVIAIIGILAGIVLASLNTAREGATDAKTKEQLSGLRTAMEVYYAQNNSYGSTADACNEGAFADANVSELVSASNYSGTPVCGASANAWAVSVPLDAVSDSWCVDSTGFSGTSTALTAGNTVCP